MEYILVSGILVLGLLAAFYHPFASGKNLGGAFLAWYHDLAERVAKP